VNEEITDIVLTQDLQMCEIMINLKVKRKMSGLRMMTPQQGNLIYCYKTSDLETPSNVNIQEGESKKQLLHIGELSFRHSEVFVYFGKENYEWFDGRGIEFIVIDWLIKEQVLEHIPIQV
jgi:hypothetical protein